MFEGGDRGGGFGFLFAFAFAGPELATVPRDFGDEVLLVLGTALGEDGVLRAARGDGLEDFLEPALWVDVEWLKAESLDVGSALPQGRSV